MGIKTDIQWADSTVNPTGFQCDGCELWKPKRGIKTCYAGRWAERIGGIGAFDEPIELKPGRMAAAAKWPDLRGQKRSEKPWIPAAYPRLVFIGDMSDNFSCVIQFEYLKTEVIDTVAKWPHIGLWLTKRPKRMAQFSAWLKKRGVKWPDNLWAGTSITSRDTLPRVSSLLDVDCSKRFLSIEPLWESIVGTEILESTIARGLEQYLTKITYCDDGQGNAEPDVEDSFIDWVITGGESGSSPCHVEWLHEIVSLCENASIEGDPVPCFVKQLGSISLTHNANTMDYPMPILIEATDLVEGAASGRLLLDDKKGGSWHEWPEQLQIRQFPNLL